MKYYDTKFEDYLSSYNKFSLNTKLKDIYNKFPDNINDMQNLIFYGPDGVGKYTQSLASISKYSPSKLTYEKKICITHNKQNYFIKISDIHFEIDMSLLGCNTKILWNEIYNHIVDIILSKPDGVGILVCKNFQAISNELLESFYSYLQTNVDQPIKIIFVLITTQISFIPDNIIQRCKIINVPRPTKAQYSKCINKPLDTNVKLDNITNIKDLYSGVTELMFPHKKLCDVLLSDIINIKKKKFVELREDIYNIFIYNIDIGECVLYIIQNLIKKGLIDSKKIPRLFEKTVSFLQYYNNNYRPIYHLESYLLYLITIIYGY